MIDYDFLRHYFQRYLAILLLIFLINAAQLFVMIFVLSKRVQQEEKDEQ